MSSWLRPEPHSETVTVRQRRIPAEFYENINGWRIGTVSQVDQFITVVGDDTATGITTASARPNTEEWVMAILTAYDRIRELREKDPDRKGMLFVF